jgi:uncharacterized protein YdiU (UPF0061 family)
MAVTTPLFAFESTFAQDVPELVMEWTGSKAPAPRLLALNETLVRDLGAEPEALRAPEGVALLAGSEARGLAMAYAGHQFGGYSPRLGDGRALLLGEIGAARRDLHLKGSGRTPFARGGDGKAAVGPMLREYVVGEAMHALGIPTTRALAVVATGEEVARETYLPGAVLARVAASHIRVGTFEYATRLGGADLVRRLADHAIDRHHPAAREAENPYLAFFELVVRAQAELIAQWMLVGFIHGVMNTDNMAISGETIDYGPCAFMEAYDPATVYSSIDHGGRYAYGNQPLVAQWNLARLAETLLALIDEEPTQAIEAATGALAAFAPAYADRYRSGLLSKLGLQADDRGLLEDLVALLREHRPDHTSLFRRLAAAARGDALPPEGFEDFYRRWRAAEPDLEAMDRVNPLYIPRNHLVEEALAAGTAGDLEPFERLTEVLADPFTERPGLERYAQPAPADFGAYRTFCGT